MIAKCAAKKLTVSSDSIQYYGDEGRTVLIGHANYKDPRILLKSDFLTYYEVDERILATQNVDARLPSGSTIKGPQVEFLRAVPRLRAQQQATATGRPTISLIERDAEGKTQPPVRVTGNTVWLKGDSVVASQGQVVVVRPELIATGDSLYGDASSGLLRVMRNPKIVGTRGRRFTLVGETIDLLTNKRKLERVLAKNAAEAESEDLNLKSDTIDMRVSGDLLQRAMVWGNGRAHATSPTQSVIADSIDVMLPGQRVREMHALRGASAEGLPDTSRFVTIEKDRLTGDTIIARFDSVPERDTTTRPRIRQLFSIGHATSLRHVVANDTTLCVPTVIYARGRLIDVKFNAGLIDTVRVTDPVERAAGGLVLEPKDDPANKCTVLRPRPRSNILTVPGQEGKSRPNGKQPVRAPSMSVPLPPTRP